MESIPRLQMQAGDFYVKFLGYFATYLLEWCTSPKVSGVSP